MCKRKEKDTKKKGDKRSREGCWGDDGSEKKGELDGGKGGGKEIVKEKGERKRGGKRM